MTVVAVDSVEARATRPPSREVLSGVPAVPGSVAQVEVTLSVRGVLACLAILLGWSCGLAAAGVAPGMVSTVRCMLRWACACSQPVLRTG